MNASLMASLTSQDRFAAPPQAAATAFSLFFNSSGLSPLEANRAWRKMTQEGREQWKKQLKRPAKQAKKSRSKAKAQGAGSGSQELTVKQMKQLLAAKGLPSTGKKAVLAARLAASSIEKENRASASGLASAAGPVSPDDKGGKSKVQFQEQSEVLGTAPVMDRSPIDADTAWNDQPASAPSHGRRLRPRRGAAGQPLSELISLQRESNHLVQSGQEAAAVAKAKQVSGVLAAAGYELPAQ